VLNRSLWVTNGWRVWRAGPVAYQTLAISNKLTHTLHGNLCYTSNVPGLIWDSNIADQDIPDSLLYAAAPSWWGTNRWPAIDPEGAQPLASIPAQDRYYGISGGGGSPPPAESTGANLRLNNLRVGNLRMQ
jgi:hypothetical protein